MCWRITTTRDHPRVCGEHPQIHNVFLISLGSSPRVRGTLRAHLRLSVGVGIIPACAGNTNYKSYALRKAWDHPRVCGEHDLLNYVDARRLGSSPRVRGTLVEGVPSVLNIGIIPACAGNTPARVGGCL